MEVLTLQFGNFANHVGAHFWNFQDEIAALEDDAGIDEDGPHIDFRRLHRQAEHGGLVSWHPRLVLVDKKGALGSIRPGTQTGQPEPEPDKLDMLWDYGTISHCSHRLHDHPFQQDLEREEMHIDKGEQMAMGLDCAGCDDTRCQDIGQTTKMQSYAKYNFSDTVQSWTDYMKVQLPNTSVCELQNWRHTIDPFATYFDGLQIKGRDDEEATLELVRRQFELCDQLDAIHAVYDMHDGFGGVADIVLRWVCDEQPKCGRLVMGVQPDQEDASVQSDLRSTDKSPTAPRETSAWVSAAFSFANLLNVGMDAWIPLAVPLWTTRRPLAMPDLRLSSDYETSALLAAALETASLPYRLSGRLRSSHFLSAIAPAHRPSCGLSLALPMPLQSQSSSMSGVGASNSPIGTLANAASYFFDLATTPLLPGNPYTSVVLRGTQPRRLVELCRGLPPQAQQLCYAHPAALPLPVTFPQIFVPQVSSSGLLPCGPYATARPGREEVEVCPVATQLHAVACAGRSGPLQHMARSMRANQRSAWAAAAQSRYGVEAEEFRYVLEAVIQHLECGAASSDDEANASDCSI